MDSDKLIRINQIALDYTLTSQNNKELGEYLYSVNRTLNIPKESCYLRERYEKEQHRLPELARFLACEQVMMGNC